MKKVFLSFHYDNDSWRVSQIKNMGVVEGQPILSSNEWEEVKRRGDAAIEAWIDDQMSGRACTIVLIGAHTANRKWVNYEIRKTWDSNKFLVGLHINRLKDASGNQSPQGANPFKYISLKNGKTLDEYVPCITPPGSTSTDVYEWIQDNIEDVIDSAEKMS